MGYGGSVWADSGRGSMRTVDGLATGSCQMSQNQGATHTRLNMT